MRSEMPANSAPITVEPARDADTRAILELHQRVLAEGWWFITHPDEFSGNPYAKLRQVRDLREHPSGLFLVARVDDQVAGFLTLSPGPLRRMAHAVKLEIMVDQAHRGLGLGRALMDAALAWARDNPRVHKVGLSVFSDNERAIALYQAYGFAEEGRREREYLEEDGTFRGDVLLYIDT